MKNVTLPFYMVLALTSYSLHASQLDSDDEVLSEAGSSQADSQEKQDPLSPEDKMDYLKTWLKDNNIWNEGPGNFSEEKIDDLLDDLFNNGDGLGLEYCQQMLKEMKNSGLWEACQKCAADVTYIFNTLHNSEEVSEEEREEFLALLEGFGAWDKCHNTDDFWSLIYHLGDISSTERVKEILEFMKELIWDQDPNGKDIGELGGTMDDLALSIEECRNIVGWMKETGLWDKYQEDRGEIILLLHTIDCLKLSIEDCRNIMDWIKEMNLWDECQDGKGINGLFSAINEFGSRNGSTERSRQILDLMRTSGIWDECQTWRGRCFLLTVIKVIYEHPSVDNCREILDWMKTPNVQQWYEKMKNIDKFFQSLERFPRERRREILEWMKNSGILDFLNDGQIIVKLFHELETFPAGMRQIILDWVKDPGIWGKFQKEEESMDRLLQTLRILPEDKTVTILTWMKAMDIGNHQTWDDVGNWWDAAKICDSIAMAKDHSIGDVLKHILFQEFKREFEKFPEGILQVLLGWMTDPKIIPSIQQDIRTRLQELKNLPEDKTLTILAWMEDIGVCAKFRNWQEIFDLVATIKDFFLEDIQRIGKWMKMSGALGQCRNIAQIQCFWSLFSNLERAFDSCRGVLIRSCLTEKTYFEEILNWHAARNFAPAKAILMGESQHISQPRNWKIYAFCHAFYKPNQELERLINNNILNGTIPPEGFLIALADLIGENHAFSQQCLTWAALERILPIAQDGFLAIYREMLLRRLAPVQHNPIAPLEGVQINPELVKEPRPKAEIFPMSVAVWDQLFRKFREAIRKKEIEFIQFMEAGETSQTLLSLQQESFLRNMLDPEDRSRGLRDVDTYSHMLRTILEHIQEANDLNLFGQLLINIKTCSTGKVNGIRHTYNLISSSRILAEEDLDSERLREQLTSHFKEELRRFREACLKQVVREITGGNDPHHECYAQGVVGSELGLMFESENPRIDLYTGGLSRVLRMITKQGFLNRFYQHYKVEGVINKIHALLGDEEAQGRAFQKNLTLSIINHYLNEAWNEDISEFNLNLVVLNNELKPSGLTQEAIKRLLIKMGFLIQQPTEAIGLRESTSAL